MAPEQLRSSVNDTGTYLPPCKPHVSGQPCCRPSSLLRAISPAFRDSSLGTSAAHPEYLKAAEAFIKKSEGEECGLEGWKRGGAEEVEGAAAQHLLSEERLGPQQAAQIAMPGDAAGPVVAYEHVQGRCQLGQPEHLQLPDVVRAAHAAVCVGRPLVMPLCEDGRRFCIIRCCLPDLDADTPARWGRNYSKQTWQNMACNAFHG